MKFIKKWLEVPGPKELGMSKTNAAMPVRWLNHTEDYTWEDYYDRIKKEYPVKYLLGTTIPRFFSRRYRRVLNHINEIIYWFKCHLFKKHKHHVVYLTQPKYIKATNADGFLITIENEDHYNYGWIDVDTKILYASFNLLNTFVENELRILSVQDAATDPLLQHQKNIQDEIMALHHWWNLERKVDQQQLEIFNDKWLFFSKRKRQLLSQRAFQDWQALQSAFDAKDDEMLLRLMKIRRSLWS